MLVREKDLSAKASELLRLLLRVDPSSRLSITEALQHSYFSSSAVRLSITFISLSLLLFSPPLLTNFFSRFALCIGFSFLYLDIVPCFISCLS